MNAERLPIVDAHHHFWDLEHNYHPWLCDEPLIAFRYGDYRAIRRSYLIEDYERDTVGFDVIASVYVETEWDPRDPLGETRWIERVADRRRVPTAVVAQAWLDRDDAQEVLAAQSEFPRVRSVRHKPRAAPHPGAVEQGARGSMGDPRWRRGYAMLESYGLAFDLQTPWWHLGEAFALARDFPNTTIILNHTGLPADRSQQGLGAWRRAMEALALAPNVLVKISGLGQPGEPWTVESNGPIVLDTIAIFGIERCMFASNMPVDGLTADFATIYRGFERIVAHLPTADRKRLFSENALGIYRPG